MREFLVPVVRCDEAALEHAAKAKYERRRRGETPWEDLHEETRRQWRSGVRRVIQDLREGGHGA